MNNGITKNKFLHYSFIIGYLGTAEMNFIAQHDKFHHHAYTQQLNATTVFVIIIINNVNNYTKT